MYSDKKMLKFSYPSGLTYVLVFSIYIQLKHGIGADLIFFVLYLCYRRTVS